MRSNGKGFLARALMLALVAFLALPAVTLAQGRGKRNKNDVFVNGHDARDGRYDGRGPRRNRDRNRDRYDDDDYRRDRRERRSDRYRDYDGDGDYDRDDEYYRRRRDEYYRRNQGGYGNYGGYGNNNYGRYTQSQQTAMNAGYNEGIKEGRKDRNRGEYRDLNEFSEYRKATKDYNSRLGDRYEYQQYYRHGFQNGYRDGLNGH